MLELASTPNIAGVKQSVDGVDMPTLELLAGAPRDFAVLGGEDAYLLVGHVPGRRGRDLRVGPRVHRAVRRACSSAASPGKVDEGRAHHEALLPVVQACFAEPNPAVFKAVLHAQGRIPTPDVRLPLRRTRRTRRATRALDAIAAAQG